MAFAAGVRQRKALPVGNDPFVKFKKPRQVATTGFNTTQDEVEDITDLEPTQTQEIPPTPEDSEASSSAEQDPELAFREHVRDSLAAFDHKLVKAWFELEMVAFCERRNQEKDKREKKRPRK